MRTREFVKVLAVNRMDGDIAASDDQVAQLSIMAERCALYCEKAGDPEKAAEFRKESQEWKKKIENTKRD